MPYMLTAEEIANMRRAMMHSPDWALMRHLLFDQAKRCQTAAGGTALLAVKNWIEGYETIEGLSELWQVADHVARLSPPPE